MNGDSYIAISQQPNRRQAQVENRLRFEGTNVEVGVSLSLQLHNIPANMTNQPAIG
mgnify:FL=1